MFNVSHGLSLDWIGEYFVTEKTDGVRQLMLVVGSGKGIRTVFVDRAVDKDNNGKSHGLQVRDCPGQVLLPSGSVLDGELVFNLHLRKHVFMVFDALQVCASQSLPSFCHTQRAYVFEGSY